jgi:branched-chain amino acid transport system substrate-binding protein
LAAGAGGTNGVVTTTGPAETTNGAVPNDSAGAGAVASGQVAAPGTVGSGQTARGAAAANPAASTAPGTVGASQPGKANTGSSNAPQGSAAVAAAGCTQKLAPIVLGQTLGATGLVGAAIGKLRLGLQLWAQAVNANGGVQCHPIQVISLDDGSDPARVASNFNELVNGKGAVAMVALGDPIADAPVKSSAERLKVPVIGGDLTSSIWTNSAYIFPQGSAVIPTFAGGFKSAAESKGAKRGGLLYCQEASICGVLNSQWDYLTSSANVTKGIAKAISITQPDYTAECQALKDDGADVVFAAMDGSAITRLARSCSALNYTPPLATVNLAINDQVAKDPNIRKFTAWLGGANVPFLSSDTPGAQEFQAAAKKFLPGVALDQSTMSGWASGKLFEAALANVADKARSGKVDSALVVEGLGKVKNETLGGLAAPLTFTPGQPAPVVPCYFPLNVGPSGFVTSTGGKKFCLKMPPKS